MITKTQRTTKNYTKKKRHWRVSIFHQSTDNLTLTRGGY